MQLKHILQDVAVLEMEGRDDVAVTDIHFDSRNIRASNAFVAQKGTQVDGHQFIDMAIAKGANVVICETMPPRRVAGVTYVKVERASQALGRMMAAFCGHPARQLKVVGVTGTNGKSSTVSLLHKLFNRLGFKSGLLSTMHYKVGDDTLPATHTTPDARQIHQLFARMLAEGCEYCFMEVSSHALAQARTEGIPFQVGIFTNITHDHLDYHGTFSAYIKAKKLLFDQLEKGATALINLDDRNARVMVQNTQATVRTFAVKQMADYRGRLLENTFEGLLLEVQGREAWFQLLGSFNAYNLLAAYAAALELGLEQEEVLQALSELKGVPGRFEVIRSSHLPVTGIVDYAHSPDALENVLSTVQDINQGAQPLVVVVGCGGDRDRAKRPKMAQIAVERGDKVILTSDNPRSEDPAVILEEMYAGIPLERRKQVLIIADRRAAIEAACQLLAGPGIVVVAGKGHETYQEIKGVRYPFDDREVLKETFEKFEI